MKMGIKRYNGIDGAAPADAIEQPLLPLVSEGSKKLGTPSPSLSGNSRGGAALVLVNAVV